VILASSLLQLHLTPWLNGRCSKKDIVFLRSHCGPPHIIIEQPYIVRKLGSFTATGTGDPSDCTESLLALGILLLELCFGQALEDQRFRKDYFGPNGKPNDLTDFATARRGQQDVLGEGGPEFANAIRRCIFCAFGPKSTNLADDDFREAVFTEVVQPLEDILRRFDSDS